MVTKIVSDKVFTKDEGRNQGEWETRVDDLEPSL